MFNAAFPNVAFLGAEFEEKREMLKQLYNIKKKNNYIFNIN